MKTVFSNAHDVIHVFAQRTQTNGRSSNIFFENTYKIYSYGHHYLLGEFIWNEKNEIAIMINDKGYSVTTSNHISWLRSGTSQYKQFYTMNTDPTQVLRQLETYIASLQKAKKPEIYIQKAETLYQSFCDYIAWNGRLHIETFPEINAAIKVFRTKDYKLYYAQKEAVLKAAEIERKKREQKAMKKALKDFFDYKVNSVNSLPEDYLRISEDQQFIETTQKVKVPIREAFILYKMIINKKDIHGYQLKTEYSIYTVIGLNGVLKIGCHKINKKNMHEIGQKLIKIFEQNS